MTTIFKPIVLESDGIHGQLIDGSIINIGGTSYTTFTVGGRGLLFDDGTSTTGNLSSITLQSVYNSTPAVSGAATINLTTGKDFVITDDTNFNIFFKVDAETGKVTITGDLEILGSSTIIDTVIQDSDHWQITPKLGTTTALKIEPDVGVIPIVDLVSIRKLYGSFPVFRIDSSGNVIASQNLTVNGLINGVNLTQLKYDVDHHASGSPGYRHLAADVDILPIASLPGATNVQEALEQINYKADHSTGGGGTVSGYAHIQTIPLSIWTIIHNKGSINAQVTIYDSSFEQIIPETVKIIDANTVIVTFTASITGRAMIVLF